MRQLSTQPSCIGFALSSSEEVVCTLRLSFSGWYISGLAVNNSIFARSLVNSAFFKIFSFKVKLNSCWEIRRLAAHHDRNNHSYRTFQVQARHTMGGIRSSFRAIHGLEAEIHQPKDRKASDQKLKSRYVISIHFVKSYIQGKADLLK
jgi:hypothetical protein